MTRAESIEKEAWRLLAAVDAMDRLSSNTYTAGDALRAALALPREESAEGWTGRVALTGFRNGSEWGLTTTNEPGNWAEPVRVRITAAPEGEEGTP